MKTRIKFIASALMLITLSEPASAGFLRTGLGSLRNALSRSSALMAMAVVGGLEASDSNNKVQPVETSHPDEAFVEAYVLPIKSIGSKDHWVLRKLTGTNPSTRELWVAQRNQDGSQLGKCVRYLALQESAFTLEHGPVELRPLSELPVTEKTKMIAAAKFQINPSDKVYMTNCLRDHYTTRFQNSMSTMRPQSTFDKETITNALEQSNIIIEGISREELHNDITQTAHKQLLAKQKEHAQYPRDSEDREFGLYPYRLHLARWLLASSESKNLVYSYSSRDARHTLTRDDVEHSEVLKSHK